MLELLGRAFDGIGDAHAMMVLWRMIFLRAAGVAAVVAACMAVVERYVNVGTVRSVFLDIHV